MRHHARVIPRLIIVILILCRMSHTAFSQASVLWGDLKPGQYRVGFKVLERYNASVKWRDDRRGRPVQISVWYPAREKEDGDASPLSYKDYFLLSLREVDFADLSESKKGDAVAEYKGLLVSNGVTEDAADAFLSARMFARPHLKVAEGSFPLIIVVQGNFHSAHHQSILCEFLASQGYVVATCPSQTRISGPMKSNEDIYPSAVEQAEDIAYLEKQVLEDFTIDLDRIGLVAHSFGARSALFYLAENNSVKAFVSLDGGIGNRQGKDFVKKMKGFDPNEIRIPILHFYEDIESFMTPDFDLINSLKNSDRYLVKVDQMNHIQFTTFGMAGATIPGFSTNRAETKLKCEAIYKLTLSFMRAFVTDTSANPGDRFEETIDSLFPKQLMHLSRIERTQN